MRLFADSGQRISGADALSRRLRGTFFFLLGAVVFGIAYTQPALYYSNQNQYFLHGLARGGDGSLAEDWLANTADPTPLFSALVAFTYRHLHESLFYAYYLLIFGVYVCGLLGIFNALGERPPNGLARLGFLTSLVVLHSALLRWGSAQLLGVDYPWYFQAGVANQYVLGAGLQPSVFGVLLILSVAAFLHDRPLEAATWSSLAAVMHSTYLLTAALLTLSYLYLLCREKRIRIAFFVGLWAFVLVLPVLIYNLVAFAPSSPEAFAESQHLLAHFRIPHHAQVERWLDGIACAQLGWIVLAAFLARGTRLAPIFFVTFTLSFLLTLVQLGTRNDTLALLFPWRASAILVPLATAIVLTRTVNELARRLRPPSLRWERALRATCGLILAVVVAGGAAISYFGLGYRTNEQEVEVLEYVRGHRASSEVYLLPVEVPPLTSARRGAASSNFMPPPRWNNPQHVIAVDWQRFRLFAGAPIYVDFKSIPYKDEEVLQWHRRLLWNRALYERCDWDAALVAELARRGITHVVTTPACDIHCDALELLHGDASYRLYRVLRKDEG